MVQVLGSMEDEHLFKFLAFCKSKLHNQFSNNLGLMIRMFFFKSLSPFTIFHMQMYMRSGVKSILSMVWELNLFKAFKIYAVFLCKKWTIFFLGFNG
jgi:hypothetical protein